LQTYRYSGAYVILTKSQSNQTVLSGEPITIEGFYKLVNHNPECFIPVQANRMFFKKREKAPMTGSCYHKAEWQFIEPLVTDRRDGSA